VRGWGWQDGQEDEGGGGGGKRRWFGVGCRFYDF
jgi:hypothetical protein